MNLPNDASLYLPKYLSAESTKKLLEELQTFPSNIDQRFYTQHFLDESVIFQGDGMKDFQVVNLPDSKIGTAPVIILSNTCDVDLDNRRNFPSRINYAPILNLEKYSEKLKDNGKSLYSIQNHLDDRLIAPSKFSIRFKPFREIPFWHGFATCWQISRTHLSLSA